MAELAMLADIQRTVYTEEVTCQLHVMAQGRVSLQSRVREVTVNLCNQLVTAPSRATHAVNDHLLNSKQGGDGFRIFIRPTLFQNPKSVGQKAREFINQVYIGNEL